MAKNLEISYLLDFYGDVLTDKQREAMELAGVDYPELSVYGLTRSFVLRLLGRDDG